MSSAPAKKRGCWFYGCVTLAIVGVISLVVGIFVVRWALALPEKLVNDFTDSAPVPIESVTLPPPERTTLEERLTAFQAALDGRGGAPEIILTARELNALIAENIDLKGKLFVLIEDDRIKGRVSVPLKEDIGPFKVKGRYLNATASFKVSLSGGTLVVLLDDAEVNGRTLPALARNELRKTNLAEDAQRDPANAEKIARFESLRIAGGNIILRGKAP